MGTTHLYDCFGISRLLRAPTFIFVLLGIALTQPVTVEAGNIFDDWTLPPGSHPVPPQSPGARPEVPAGNSGNRAEDALPMARRRPVPSGAAQSKSRSLFKKFYAKQLSDHSIAERCKLAELLWSDGAKVQDNPVDRFVLLAATIEAAKEGGNLELCCRAAAAMGDDYDIDAMALKTDMALHFSSNALAESNASENVSVGMQIVDDLVRSDDLSHASQIATLLARAAYKDTAQRTALQKRINEINLAKAAHERIEASLKKLSALPHNPEANQVVGEYLCFVKGQWASGLPMLSQGANPELALLAHHDLEAGSAEDHAEVAGEWWTLSEKPGEHMQHSRQLQIHAVELYRAALPELTEGLQKVLAEKRILAAMRAQAATASIDNNSLVRQRTAGSLRLDNGASIKLAWCPPGRFLMGSPPTEKGRRNGETQVVVTLSKGFWLGQTGVTEDQWRTVMGTTPWAGRLTKEGPSYPVTFVTWDDAAAFCQKLTASEVASGRLTVAWRYDLPTEAQREYACRAGSTTAYCFGDDPAKLNAYAWWGIIFGNGDAKNERYAHPVGLKKPNSWGLYDMHGNVWEWCRDYYADRLPGGEDPFTSVGKGRAYRGGCWIHDERLCRSANRYTFGPFGAIGDLGFRVALVQTGISTPASGQVPPPVNSAKRRDPGSASDTTPTPGKAPVPTPQRAP